MFHFDYAIQKSYPYSPARVIRNAFCYFYHSEHLNLLLHLIQLTKTESQLDVHRDYHTK